MSTQTGKDVLYIDIDDEITTIIDKVRGSEEKIVALVLPKRATVFQSIVNMKLLKRSADESKKHLVLITNEAGLLPLAGAVGVYVAKSLQSRPEIPAVPGGMQRPADDTEEFVNMNDEPRLDKNRAVGDYAAAAAPGTVVGAASSLDDDKPIELDNASMDTPGGPPSKAAAAKAKKDKKLKIPDFNKFRTWIILGGVGLVFIIFLFWIALGVMPRATVLVKTDSEAIQTNLDVTLSTSADDVNVDSAVVPAVSVQSEKTATQQVAATGQKDKGTKASGQVTIKNCSEDEVTVPAGTGVSANGLTFITQDSLSLDSGNFTGSGSCKPNGGHVGSVDVIAQNVGDKYNLSAMSYSISGMPSTVTGSGSQMSGGTTNIVKVVQQSDIDSAKQKIASQDANSVKADLKGQLQSQGVRPIEATLASSPSDVTTNVQVGAEAEAVTVSQKTTYTMTGAKDSDLKKLIANEVNKQIDPTKQTILDYGLDEAEFKVQNQTGRTVLVALDNTAVAGTDVNVNDMKKQVAGKKSAEAKEIIGKYPGVTSVDVHYSPFWVSSIPKNTGKITISIEKPAVKNAD
jgi:hypothetical protein